MVQRRRGGRRTKEIDVLARVRASVAAGKYFDTRHANARKLERVITLPEVLYVLKNGFHEKKKDEFKEEFKAWNYAIRGATLDKRQLRICVSFDPRGMLIITTIDLDV